MKILFIGGGNMATALIGGILQQGGSAGDIRVVEVVEAARASLQQRYGVHVESAVPAQLSVDEIVVLAVKPQQLQIVAQGLAPHLAGQLVVTIAAGISTAALSRWLGGYGRIVRVMPNTPAMLRAGVSALFAMASVDAQGREQAQAVLDSVGTTLWVDREELMDAVTAVSGSGPAYVFYFMEAMIGAAQDLGLTPEQARQLTLETFAGAAALARHSDEPPQVLRARVTSKGGTTERAVSVLQAEQVGAKLAAAIRQAAQRSRELGESLGQ